MKRRTCLVFIIIAAGATLPGTFARLAGVESGPLATAALAGLAILAAAFLVLWACDVVQTDISQSLALAVVALIGVLPEYAVDMYFTWQAGKHPGADYAGYAIANMTGANRLIIGVGWVVIVGIVWLRARRAVQLESERRTELVFLGLATVYAFFVAIKGSLVWYDGLVFVALYGWYLTIASRRPCAEVVPEGPAEVLYALPKVQRRVATIAMFLFAGGAILANAEPFCEGLVASGKLLGINEFFLVQWLAPIASEAPEFVVATMFALRGQASLALGALLSAKVNQWTLLVGTIPAVYAVSLGSLAHPIPMGSFQMHEILLTAAQSLLGLAMLVTLRFSVAEGLVLFVLFIGQFAAPFYQHALPWDVDVDQVHQVFSLLYVVLAVVLMAINRKAVMALRDGLRVVIASSGAIPCGRGHSAGEAPE